MIETLHTVSDKVLAFKLSGKLHDNDYARFVPAIDAAVGKPGKVRLMTQFHDFQCWDLKALWDDIKFSTTHCTKIDRIALVGEKNGKSGWPRSASRSRWPKSSTSTPPTSTTQGSGSPKGCS